MASQVEVKTPGHTPGKGDDTQRHKVRWTLWLLPRTCRVNYVDSGQEQGCYASLFFLKIMF